MDIELRHISLILLNVFIILDGIDEIRSIVKLRQHGHSTLDPMSRVRAFFDRQLNTQDVVGRVTSSREHSSSNRCLVNWSNVGIALTCLLLSVCGDKPHVWDWRIQNLVVGFIETFQILVPSRTIKEQSVHVTSILRIFGNIVLFAILRQDQEIKGESVDRVFILNKNRITFRA